MFILSSSRSDKELWLIVQILPHPNSFFCVLGTNQIINLCKREKESWCSRRLQHFYKLQGCIVKPQTYYYFDVVEHIFLEHGFKLAQEEEELKIAREEEEKVKLAQDEEDPFFVERSIFIFCGTIHYILWKGPFLSRMFAPR
jgi:hypothetical protein